MLPPKCYYPGRARSLSELAGTMEDFFRSSWDKALQRGIDGYNLADSIVDEDAELKWIESTGGVPRLSRALTIPILSRTSSPSIRRKGASGTTGAYRGLELVVDASDATYGRVCVLDKDYLTSQLISMVPDDPASVTNPGGTLLTPLGSLTLNTGGAFNQILQRNSVTQLTLDGTNLVSNDRHLISTTTNTADIGTSTVGWREIFARTIDTDGANNLVLQRNNVTGLTLTLSSLTLPLETDIRPSADSTAAINIANAAGTDFAIFDTTNSRLRVGAGGPPSTTLDVRGDITILSGSDIRPTANATNAINIANAAGTDFVSFDTTSNRVGIGISTPGTTLDVRGDITILSGSDIRPTTNATNAINIANAAGTDFVSFDTTNNRVGIGISAPGFPLHISSTETNLFVCVNFSDIAANGSQFFLRRARGTASAPLGTVDGDRLAFYGAQGHTGSTFNTASALSVEADGAPTAAFVPGRMVFRTSTTTATDVERMRITSAGRVGIGTGVPGTTLDVRGDITILSGSDIRPTANATNAINIANAAGTDFVSFDTTNSRVGIGTSTPERTLVVAGASPAVILLRDNGGAVDNKNWYFDAEAVAGVSFLFHGSINDAVNSGFNYIRITRSGITTTEIATSAPTVIGGTGTGLNALSGTGRALTINNGTSTGDILECQDNGVRVFEIADGGNITVLSGIDIRPTANATNAINIANAAGTDFVSFDTTNSRVGISTSTPTNTLSLGGAAARKLWMERNTDSIAGNNFTIEAGGASSLGTNLSGGSLLLSSGIATGSGSSVIDFYTVTAGVSGTADVSPTIKMRLAGSGQLSWSTGLGASVQHILGPSDQNFKIASPTSRTIRIESSSDITLIPTGGGLVDFNNSTVSLGASAAALGNVPTGVATAQNAWLSVKLAGTTVYIPVWAV